MMIIQEHEETQSITSAIEVLEVTRESKIKMKTQAQVRRFVPRLASTLVEYFTFYLEKCQRLNQ